MITGIMIALLLLVFILVLLCVEIDSLRRRIDHIEDTPAPSPFDWDER